MIIINNLWAYKENNPKCTLADALRGTLKIKMDEVAQIIEEKEEEGTDVEFIAQAKKHLELVRDSIATDEVLDESILKPVTSPNTMH